MKRENSEYVKYKDKHGFIEISYKSGITIVSAHCFNNGKYSIGMFRYFIKFIDKEKIIFTELRYDYLVKFFSKHYDIIHTKKDYYILRSR